MVLLLLLLLSDLLLILALLGHRRLLHKQNLKKVGLIEGGNLHEGNDQNVLSAFCKDVFQKMMSSNTDMFR